MAKARAMKAMTGKAPRTHVARPTRTARTRMHFVHTHYVRAFTTKFRAH